MNKSETTKKINTVIFDFDGTIADTNQLIVDSWQAVYRARTGAEGDVDYILSTFGEPLYYSMEKAFPDFDLEETVSIYRDFQRTIFRDAIKPFPGMGELIKGLKDKGYKTGIVTSRLKASTLEGLESMGLEDYIDDLVTVEDTEIHKPNPEPALICLEKLGRKPEESLMIGDSDFDIGCGNNAGMVTVLVGWSAAAKSERESVARTSGADACRQVEAEGDKDAPVTTNPDGNPFVPDHIIDEAKDLWAILEQE